MKKRLIIVIPTVLAICAAVAAGIIFRNNHRRIVSGNEDNLLGDTCVTQLNDDYFFTELDLFKSYRNNSEYILKIRCNKNTQLRYQACLESGEVLKVFKSNGDIAEGDEISFNRESYHLFTAEGEVVEKDTANVGFVNFMKQDREYLVFLKEKIESELYDFPIYVLDGFIIAPVFCYEDFDNVIIEEDSQVKYSLVKDNEVFVQNEELEKMFYDFKHRILSETDDEYSLKGESGGK